MPQEVSRNFMMPLLADGIEHVSTPRVPERPHMARFSLSKGTF
jgi:hypothetical protein